MTRCPVCHGSTIIKTITDRVVRQKVFGGSEINKDGVVYETSEEIEEEILNRGKVTEIVCATCGYKSKHEEEFQYQHK